MTPPGGSRDDDAGNALRRDAAPGRARSPDTAGEDDRDPQLQAMRAVWLSMRDEDPPDRGLADLLAAARHKAAELQPRPTAWQRLRAALRRPPVLAFATVTVLIAGAVLIGRRVPHAAAPSAIRAIAPSATPPATDTATEPTAEPTAAETATADRAGAASTTREALSMPPPAAPPSAAAAPPGHHSDSLPAPALRATLSPSPSIPASPTAPADQGVLSDEAREAAAPPAPEPTAPAAAEPARPEQPTRLGAFSEAPSQNRPVENTARIEPARPPRPEPQAPPPADAANHAARGAANHAVDDRANNAPSNAPSNASRPTANSVVAPPRRTSPAGPRSSGDGDLYQQCEAAALRSDCATVRRLVSQITRTDRGYRARLAKDSPVGKCLVE